MDNDAFHRFLAVAMGAVMSYRTDDDGLLLVFVTDFVIETMSVVGVGEIGNDSAYPPGCQAGATIWSLILYGQR